jgi:hypothetical protein
LHLLRPKSDGFDGIDQLKDAGGREGRILTQAVPGHVGWRPSTRRQVGAIKRHRATQHHGLGIDRQTQFLGRSIRDEGCKVLPQRIAGLLKGLLHDSVTRKTGQHTDRLRTLAGK